MTSYSVVAVAPDDYVVDSTHDNLDDALDVAGNLGSKWVFYPYITIVEGNGRDLEGRRLYYDDNYEFFNLDRLQNYSAMLTEM